MEHSTAELLEMLTYRRPHGSDTERFFIWKYLAPLGCEPFEILHDGTPAAWVKTIPMEDGSVSSTMFSSHTDTVHRDDGHQVVMYDAHKATAYKVDGTPLGADDGAGVWLMMQMIRAGVPGTYMFHRGEEKGGIGSSHIASYCKEFLKQYDHAVAFDRKATSSIITQQSGGRCCSDEFAEALSDSLNILMPEDVFAPDDGGIYTDTAEYIEFISECTNVSCGYYNEHTAHEYLDVAFLVRLAEAVCAVDWTTLPKKRKPTPGGRWGMALTGFDLGIDEDEESASVEDLIWMTDEDVENLCWDNPRSAAQIIIELREHLDLINYKEH